MSLSQYFCVSEIYLGLTLELQSQMEVAQAGQGLLEHYTMSDWEEVSRLVHLYIDRIPTA